MSTKSVKKNYVYNVAYQILTIITPLITTPYISRCLGAAGIGVYSYSASIVTYFAMAATLGTARYGQREISYNQEDCERRSEYFWKTEAMCCTSTLISTILFLLYSIFLSHNPTVFIVQVFSILTIAADITWFFQGMEEFAIIVKRNFIFRAIDIAFIFLAVRSQDDLILYICGLSLITFLGNLSLWPYLRKYIKKPKRTDIYFLPILPEVLTLFVPSIAISVYTVLDKTMIGLITGSDFENGYYEQALKASRMIMTLLTSISVVMMPRIGHHFAEKDAEKVTQYMYKSYRFIWMTGIALCAGLAAVAPNVVPWFYGDGYEPVIPLLRVSSLLILAVGINNVTGSQYLIPTKRQNQYTVTVVIGAVVNLILNYFLISKHQAIGAAIASVAAETVIAVVQLIMVKKELSARTILKLSCRYFISGIIMFLVVSYLASLLTPSVFHTLLLTLVGITVYCGLLFLLRDSFFIEQCKSVLAKITMFISKLKTY